MPDGTITQRITDALIKLNAVGPTLPPELAALLGTFAAAIAELDIETRHVRSKVFPVANEE